MSAAREALEAYIHEHDHDGHRPGWISERQHAAERAVLLEALARVAEAEALAPRPGIVFDGEILPTWDGPNA